MARRLAMAARVNSNCAPPGPLSRSRPMQKMRFNCANSISTFFRWRRVARIHPCWRWRGPRPGRLKNAARNCALRRAVHPDRRRRNLLLLRRTRRSHGLLHFCHPSVEHRHNDCSESKLPIRRSTVDHRGRIESSHRWLNLLRRIEFRGNHHRTDLRGKHISADRPCLR